MNQKDKLTEAKLLFASGQLDACIELFSQAEESGSDLVDICLSRGAALMALGRFIEASNDFTKVLNVSKKHERAHYFRGIARAALGRYQEAIEDLTVSLAQNNGRGIAHLIRGLALSELGHEQDGVLDINSAAVFSEAELASFKKLFGGNSSLFENSRQLLAEENAPWNNMLSKDAASKLQNLLQ